MSEEGTWVNIGGDSDSEKIARDLNWGIKTPRLDQGPQTPGLDSNPIRELSDFVTKALDAKDSARVVSAASPARLKVESTFIAMPAQNPRFDRPFGKKNSKATQLTGAGSFSSGAFCTLYEDPAESGDWFVSGGPVIAGDKNFDVPAYAVTVTGSPADQLLFVTLNVEVNRDDDADYFMPNIKTSSDASGSLFIDDIAASSDYPNSTNPLLSSGLGILKLLVGRVSVTGAVPSFFPTACGGFRATHCGGTLSYVRF